MEILDSFNHTDDKYLGLYENLLLHKNASNTEIEQASALEKTIISAINTRLERAATYSQGLNIFLKFASSISKENLTKHFPHWIGKLTHALTNNANDSQELALTCKAIGTLFINCKQVAELDKRISIYNIKQIIGIIADRYSQEANGAFLNLLKELLYHYPESCARFQLSLGKIISLCIDSNKDQLVTSGAKLYALLVRATERSFVPNSKDNSIAPSDNSYIKCHISHQINLCNNLRFILDEIFQDLITITSEVPYENSTTDNILNLPKISRHDILEYYANNETRFINTCVYLSTLLKAGGVAGKKYVLPNVILHTIHKGLSITPANLQKYDENKKVMLLSILSKIHLALLNILEALILSFRQELLHFGFTIQRLILQSLEYTQQISHELFSNIRILAYKILSTWLKEAQSLSGFQFLANEFLPHILYDISSSNKNILTLTSKGSKNSSKSHPVIEKSQEIKNLTKDKNSLLYCQVLSTLQSIISNVHSHLKSSFYDSIKSTIVLLLYEHYVKKISTFKCKLDAECRLHLLRTLRVLIKYSHFSTPSPTSYAIQIYGIASSQDSSSRIVEEANIGLAEIRLILYPTSAALFSICETNLYSPSRSTSHQSNNIINAPRAVFEKQILNGECDAENDPIKRPRLSEEYNSKQNTVSPKNVNKKEINETIYEETIVSVAVTPNKDENVLNFEDNEMIMSFCDITSSNGPDINVT